MPPDYSPVISVVESKFELVDVEVEVLVLAHELRMKKHRKKSLAESVAVNLVQSLKVSSESVTNQVNLAQDSTPESLGFPSSSGAFRGRGDRFGRGGRFSNVQCLVCFKFGHLASS